MGVASLRLHPEGQDQTDANTAASAIRVPVEWSFGKIDALFPFIETVKKMKLNEREIGVYMVVAALLTNIHTCLYGSQTSLYFSSNDDIVIPPSLESYMKFD
jgi:hypothetical protein